MVLVIKYTLEKIVVDPVLYRQQPSWSLDYAVYSSFSLFLIYYSTTPFGLPFS